MLRALVLVLLLPVGLAHGQEGLPRSAGAPVPVDLELVLLADSTSSIDAIEFSLQRRGTAAALVDPDVLAAIRAGGAFGRIAFAYVEWSSARRQVTIVDWTLIDGPLAAAGVAARLVAAPRGVRGVNAIGAALLHGLGLIEANGFAGARKVIDLSGDSAWNPRRPTLAEARAAADAAGVGINALAVLCENCSGRQGAGNLEQQFRDEVITGPGAFVVTADGHAAFAEAIRRKLVLEIAGATRPPAESDLARESISAPTRPPWHLPLDQDCAIADSTRARFLDARPSPPRRGGAVTSGKRTGPTEWRTSC